MRGAAENPKKNFPGWGFKAGVEIWRTKRKNGASVPLPVAQPLPKLIIPSTPINSVPGKTGEFLLGEIFTDAELICFQSYPGGESGYRGRYRDSIPNSR
jgi:hypothetical protein